MGLPDPPLIVHVIHSLQGGGTERVLLRLLQQFDHRKFRHAVITLRQAGELASQLPDNVACIALESRGRRPLNGLRLAVVLRQLRPAMVHARNTGTWADTTAACLLHRSSRLLLGFHGLEDRIKFTPRNRLAITMARLAGAEFSSVSHHGARLLETAGVPSDRITVIPNGVPPFDGATANRSRIREELGLSPRIRVFGTVGSLKPVKGHETLFRAFARLANSDPGYRLLVVGDGPLRGALEQLAHQLGVGDSVIFAGDCSNVPDLLGAMDAYVCASRSEEMSNALMEAMTAGLPVISTDVGDHSLLVRNGVEGWLVPPENPEALMAAMRRISITDQGKIGRSAALRAANFSFERTVAAYETMYCRISYNVRKSQPHMFVSQCQKVSPLPQSLAPSFNQQ